MEQPNQNEQRTYPSNPLRLALEAAKALGVNLGPLVKNFFMPFVVFGGLIVALGIVIGIGVALIQSLKIVAFVIIAAAVIATIVIGIYFAALFGALQIAISLADANNQPINYKETWHSYKPLAWRYFGMQLLIGLIILGGTLLLVVPGILFGAWYSMAPFIMIDQRVGVGEAMRQSKQLAKGHVFELLGVGALIIVASAGNNLPRFGPIFYPIVFVLTYAGPVMYAMRYKQYTSANGGVQPKIHVLNYVLVAAAPFAFAAAIALGGLPVLKQVEGALHPVAVETDCYKVSVNSTLKPLAVDAAGCSVIAGTKDAHLSIQPVVTDAASAEDLYNQQQVAVYSKEGVYNIDSLGANPSASSLLSAVGTAASTNQLLPSDGVPTTFDGANATTITLKQGRNEVGSIYFILYPDGAKSGGQTYRGFIIVERAIGGVDSKTWHWVR